jgi:hypothetical protein
LEVYNHQGDFTFNCHFVDAAPFLLKIPNCRKNNTNIVTGNKRILCCNRKGPIFFGFLRYSDDSTAIEIQIFNEQNGNKIYFNDSKAQRINILMVLDKFAGPFFGILYNILFGCGKNNEIKQTNQNKKQTTQPSIVALGTRIKGPKFISKRDSSIFSCISAIILDATKISGNSHAVKRRWCQQV